VTALDLTSGWEVPNVAAAVLRAGVTVSTAGDQRHRFRLASISKTITAWATLVAVEEGIIELESPVGQPGCTLRHLLAHAGGYPFEGAAPIAAPGKTRIYSNTGFDLVADAVAERSAMPFADYLAAAVFEPLGMGRTELIGSAAHGVHGDVTDLALFVAEVGDPRLIHADTAAEAVRPQWPELAGIVPGMGRFDRCPWGLGFELRGGKEPHWTGRHNTASTFGHFGGAGTMFWIDPDVDPRAPLALIALTDRDFDEWARRAWPDLSDAVVHEFAGKTI
jgi:CubicO group peptidase (beta-lactamase class C family)